MSPAWNSAQKLSLGNVPAGLSGNRNIIQRSQKNTPGGKKREQRLEEDFELIEKPQRTQTTNVVETVKDAWIEKRTSIITLNLGQLRSISHFE
jgi:hypothetical protein